MDKYSKHHIVPKAYLQMFTTDRDYSFVLDKKEKKIFRSKFHDLFFIKDFYRIDDKDIPSHAKEIVEPLSIETGFFHDQIEGHLGYFLKQIQSFYDEASQMEKEYSANYMIPDVFIEDMLYFLIIQRFRSPQARKVVKDVLKEIREEFTVIRNSPLKEYIQTPFDLNELDKEYCDAIEHHMTLFGNPEIIKQNVQFLMEQNVYLLLTNNLHFCTSDQPIIIDNPTYDDCDNLFMKLPGTSVYYPLTKNVLLAVEVDKDKEFKDDVNRKAFFVDDSFVMKFNEDMLKNADRFMVSSSKDMLEKLKTNI